MNAIVISFVVLYIVACLLLWSFYTLVKKRNSDLNQQTIQWQKVISEKRKEFKALERKKQELNELAAYNTDIVNRNKKLKNETEMSLLTLKEEYYKQYRRYDHMLTMLVTDWRNQPMRNMYIDEVNDQLRYITKDFKRTFKMHPEEYAKTKVNITGQNQLGDDYFTSSTLN